MSERQTSAPREPDHPWGRWFVEIVVIVLSILLAFAIEAWWDERQEREDEREILAGLEREFTDYHDKLSRAIEKHDLMRTAMEELLQATESGRWTTTEFTLDEAVIRSMWPPTTELSGGVRDALIQAGRLEVISNRALREKLALWAGIHAEVFDDEEFSRGIVFNQMMPFLISQGFDLSGVLHGLSGADASGNHLGQDESEVQRLLGDRRFRALIQFRLGFWIHAMQEYETGLQAIEEILALIDQAQERLEL